MALQGRGKERVAWVKRARRVRRWIGACLERWLLKLCGL